MTNNKIMQVTYQNNFWDILWFNLDPLPRIRFYQIAYVFLLLWFGYTTFDSVRRIQGPVVAKVLAFTVIMLGLLLAIAILHILFLAVSYYFTDAYRIIKGRCQLVVSHDGLAVEYPQARSEAKWDGITNIRQSGNLIVIHLSESQAALLPKRAFASSKEADQFFRYIREL